MKVAVIGAGLAGRQHIQAIQRCKSCSLDFIVDPSDESIQLARNAHTLHFPDIKNAFTTQKPDGAIIATPNAMHLPHALYCIERNIPILVEKPLSSDLKSALSMVKHAQDGNVHLLTGHHRRHNKLIQTQQQG